eukprot:scaffold53556_cov32-Tisochrysis_lutea.AAC.3
MQRSSGAAPGIRTKMSLSTSAATTARAKAASRPQSMRVEAARACGLVQSVARLLNALADLTQVVLVKQGRQRASLRDAPNPEVIAYFVECRDYLQGPDGIADACSREPVCLGKGPQPEDAQIIGCNQGDGLWGGELEICLQKRARPVGTTAQRATRGSHHNAIPPTRAHTGCWRERPACTR